MEDSKLEGWSFFFLLHTSMISICLETSSFVFHPPPFAHLSLPASIGCEALSFLVDVAVCPAMVPSPPFTSPSSPITPVTPVTPIINHHAKVGGPKISCGKILAKKYFVNKCSEGARKLVKSIFDTMTPPPFFGFPMKNSNKFYCNHSQVTSEI